MGTGGAGRLNECLSPDMTASAPATFPGLLHRIGVSVCQGKDGSLSAWEDRGRQVYGPLQNDAQATTDKARGGPMLLLERWLATARISHPLVRFGVITWEQEARHGGYFNGAICFILGTVFRFCLFLSFP